MHHVLGEEVKCLNQQLQTSTAQSVYLRHHRVAVYLNTDAIHILVKRIICIKFLACETYGPSHSTTLVFRYS